MSARISVVLPTHNPRIGNLEKVLSSLRAQTIPPGRWETLLVDNASNPRVRLETLQTFAPENLRLLSEPRLGLTAARRCGALASSGQYLVFVDDDNVLAPDYLEQVGQCFERFPGVGALGGRIRPVFESRPPDWAGEFEDLIACRDFGDVELISAGLRDPASGRVAYPSMAPVGAGMALRRAALNTWLSRSPAEGLTDRRGKELTSGGDNDIIFTLMAEGWEVGYFPGIYLSHLIPAERMTEDYLARLNRAVQKSWMQVLTKHGANPWPPVAGWTVPVRKLKAWFAYRAWSNPRAHVRWSGACGHFEGRIAGHRDDAGR